ncbi:MAG: hypothetical protein ACKOES_00990, partial [Planctomycetaceae bacterium]
MTLTHLRPTLGVVAILIVACAAAIHGPGVRAAEPIAKEQELLAVLRSDAPEADKAITCKYLAVYGSSAAVADLAKLLGNPHLASWARIPLEVIPGPEADSALRAAAGSLGGRALVGVINSIGVRGDATAVPLLEGRLKDGDAEVAAGAPAARGAVGPPAGGDAGGGGGGAGT